MGIEFTIDNLDDMCAVMCDNVIPRKEKKEMDASKDFECGTCKWHRNYTGEWVCMNPESEYYGLETDYDDHCEDYEERNN